MAFSDRPRLSNRQKLGCLIYMIGGVLLSAFGLLFASLGDCAPDASGVGCENDGVFKLIAFPGLFLLTLLGGIILTAYMMKDRS